MASVILAAEADAAPSHADLAHERVVALQEWLSGHWAIVLSNPEDFAPHASTPCGFVNYFADGVLAAGVKPIAFGHSLEPLAPSWLDHAVNDDSVVLLEQDGDRVVDLAERALAAQLAALRGPFVLILDQRGRCRLTLQYRQQSRQHRPCTMRDLLEMVEVLRGR
jgi:alkyl hydroperoxide reductase subunit AhpC